ncbi:hypothetical protein ACS0TY_024225 [Phlomoides rotata]
MKIKRSKDKDIWIVSYFIEKHNHALTTPSRVHLLSSHRKMSTIQKDLAKHFSEANIPTCQQVRLLEIDVGGSSMIGCLERDIRNHKRNVESELYGHDAETLLHYFEMEKEKNENFYFVYETDDDGVFLRCFWVDDESRRSYAYFGDAIVFDTTYNTNKYSMVFAPFVGVNHHRQTILFGCGLLSDEKTNSFTWLFLKFLECMPTKIPPCVIITDQDAPISKAISEVFPDTMHKFCLWHILNKFSEKLNARLYKDHYHTILHIIKESKSVAEFEKQWLELMNSTELEKNEWLSNMYMIRHRWIPAYVRHVFAAGMSSSQRVESNHSFFKRYVDHKNSLVDFITRFNRALVHQRHKELVANHIDCNEVPRMVTRLLMEQQMSSIYTKTIFLLFQKELQDSMTYVCRLISSTNETLVYTVERFEKGKTFNRQRKLTHHVSGALVSCGCQLFEFEGYPCRHMLFWMRVTQVMLLPDNYITQRWIKKAKFLEVDGLTPALVEGQSLISRCRSLAHIAIQLVDECSLTEARTNFLIEELQNLKKRATEIDDGVEKDRQTNGRSREFSQVVQDPHHVRAKGCGKRLKSSKEIAMSQSSRTCSVCSRNGHDKQTCPDLHSTYYNMY